MHTVQPDVSLDIYRTNPLLDSNPLLESVRVRLPPHLWEKRDVPQYSSILGIEGIRGKAYSKLPFCSHDTESDEQLISELCSQRSFVDQAPLDRSQKSIPPFRSVSMYDTGPNSTDFLGSCSPKSF